MRTAKDQASSRTSLGRRVVVWIRIELVQTRARAEPIRTASVHLRVALPRRDVHAAHRVLGGRAGLVPGVTAMPGVVTVTTAAVAIHHVGAAPEAHHEIEQRRKQ